MEIANPLRHQQFVDNPFAIYGEAIERFAKALGEATRERALQSMVDEAQKLDLYDENCGEGRVQEPSAYLPWVATKVSNGTSLTGETIPEERKVEPQTHTATNGKGHWDSMPTGDLLQRLQAVESAIAMADARHRELINEMDKVEKDRNAAEAEKRELGITVIRRLGFDELLRSRAPQAEATEGRRSRHQHHNPGGKPGGWRKGLSENNKLIRVYLERQPKHQAHVSDIMSAFPHRKTLMAVAAAVAKAAKDGVIRRGTEKGTWQLA